MSGVANREELKQSLAAACDWLSETAQVRTKTLTVEKDSMSHGYKSWKGAIRGEYRAAERQWGFFCPVWHTGQAVRALLLGADLLREERYLAAARAGTEFILDKQVWDVSHPDHGLILAFEDFSDKVNTSAVLECLAGLMDLAEAEGSQELWERAETAADFLLQRLFMPEEGLFRDVYDPAAHGVMLPNPYLTKEGKGGRPLLDDAILARIYERSGRKDFLDAHIRISETLVADQNPAGNWLDYGPCNAATRSFHPRHTYWWALPLLDTWRLTGRSEFLDTALAAGDFCRRAMRHDGGWIRGLYLDEDGRTFNTDCFGHAASGSACAAILFMALHRATGDRSWLSDAGRAIEFCRSMQFRDPDDPNLKGAVLEKVLAPGGSDRSPYHVRDLGTIFYIIAVAQWLELEDAPASGGGL